MIRKTITRPGYDCVRHPCGKHGCGTHPGSNHGIHCDDWVFVVSEGDLALTLTVFSGIFPASVPIVARRAITYPMGADITLHVGFPSTAEEMLGKESRECEHVSTGRCFGMRFSTSLGARDFVEEWFDKWKGTDQSEMFWLAMERRFADWAKEARDGRCDTTHKVCPKCEGIGIVRNEPVTP